MAREKTLRRIITFRTTTDAIAFERYCLENNIPGRLIPVPGEISAGCGMCWMVPLDDAGEADSLASEKILRTEGIFWIVI
ncbi:MAG: DUF3343 domain-containing protein [Clostridiales bacterium]|nr:DUF3343 domain-containing protein [Clostridiales bacterium]